MYPTIKKTLVFIVLISCMMPMNFAHAVVDSFKDGFDSAADGTSVDGVNSWSVTSGNKTDAVAQSSVTSAGSGNSLKLSNALAPVSVSRKATYGNVSPAWVEFLVRPGLGNQVAALPSKGIGAVTFNFTGDILTADGKTWVNTGQSFVSNTWYRVLLKVDFSTHMYDVYISPASTTKTPFVPDKENLHFIDPTVNSISQVGFDGVYNATTPGDTFIDDMVVHFIERSQIITPTQTIGQGKVSNPIIIQLQNSNSEPQTAWQDIALEIQSSTQTGEFSINKDQWAPISQLIIPQGSQQVTVYYKDTTKGKPVITVKESPNRGWQEATQQFNVIGTDQTFEVSATSPQIAGRAFTAQITVKDDTGNVNKLFNGTVEISASYVSPASGSKSITPDNTAAFTNGVANVTLTYSDCGTINITVKDNSDSSKSGKSGPIIFVPDKFTLIVGPIQTVSKPFNMTISALNASSEYTPNYQGLAAIKALGVNPPDITGGVIAPSQLGTEQFTNGVAQLPITYNLWGTVNLQVHDETAPDQKGVLENIYFGPNAISAKAAIPTGGRDFYYTGESFNVVLSVLDALALPIPNFQGDVTIQSEPKFDGLEPSYLFTSQDRGTKTLALSTQVPGTYVFKFEIADGLMAQTEPVNVKQATIQVVPTVAPIGKTQVEIQLLDDKGKRITTEGFIPIVIKLVESNGNGSVFLDSPGKPILFHNGVAKIVIGDTEAETITINPESSYGFKIQSGTVTFGKVGKSGIGTLLYWEDKDDAEGHEKGKK